MKKTAFIIIVILLLSTIPIQDQQQVSSQTNERHGLFNMSYIYFGGLNSYVNQVDKTRDGLHVVSPNYFDVTREGELDITWRLQSSFISEMQSRGIKVVPFLANHWDVTAGKQALENREKLAQDIADAIRRYNLDGVNVDIEGVNHEYREEHNEFIRLLREHIPDHKEVSVAVAANPNNWQTGWHGIYDYKELSKYSDYLMIMAYDESWESPDSPVGPVSSLQFFERSIQYAINQGVPRDKIVAGLPFYGRMWKLDGPTDEGRPINGMGLAHNRIEPLVNDFNGSIKFDEDTQSTYARFQIPDGESAFVGSTKLTPGDYVIWYDNEPAIRSKLRLPKEYNIKGTGSWALSLEAPGMWDYYTQALNRQVFTDVPIHYWAAPSIDVVNQKGWMKGTSASRFSPTNNLTRAQGAVVIVRALEQLGHEPDTYQFNDLDDHWAQEEIEIARDLGYLEGKSTTEFDPDAYLTRAELAKILDNIFEYPLEDDSNPFSDLRSDHWAYDSIVALYRQDIIGGFPDGSFRPGTLSTRAQMAALMERMEDAFEGAITNGND
ncbi:glycosyl hydrolase family 18 protein [Alkalibacillus aidingensis]|uniref:glycosyl hydrolase family 18 protein n=1 Tax=Alkalibacillus aidingensis TaxID=2747607 RepID=UPI0016615792|nr:glycosyl hydrolase family 18 protein [Alkalibacillus aidingensis]